MKRGILAILAVLLMLVSLGSVDGAPGNANEFGGKDRAGVATKVLDPLDVVGTFDLLDEGEETPSAFSQGIVATKHGLMVIAVEIGGDSCKTLHIDAATLQNVAQGPRFPCDAASQSATVDGDRMIEGTTATGYDPVADQVLACTVSMGESPVIRAIDAGSGEPLWGLSVQDLGLVAPDLPRIQYANDPWYCINVSLDIEQRVAVAAVSTYADRNVVVKFDLDTGDVRWLRTITPASVIAAGAADETLVPSASARDGFVAWNSALTDTGIMISGAFSQNGGRVANVWMDRDGETVGWAMDAGASPSTLADEPETGPRLGQISGWSVSGSLSSFALADQLYLVEPTTVSAVQYPLVGWAQDPADPYEFWPDPAWWDDHLLVALTGSLTNYDSSTGQARWTLSNPAGWQPSDLLIGPPSDVYMLAARSGTEGDTAALFRIGIHDGELLHRLPLPGQAFTDLFSVSRNNAIDWGARMLPLADGRMVVMEDSGHVMVLGEAPAELRPDVSVSNRYPDPAAAVTVQVDAPGDASSVLLAWGDGSVNEVETGQTVTHSYGESGVHAIRATAVYPDHRTATTTETIDVGGTPPTPPPDLNFLQTAFARENQDLTFGVLGIAVAVLGGLIAIAARARRRGRLQKELDAIDRLVAGADGRPAELAAVVQERRAHARGLVVDGYLEEGQSQILERHLDDVLREGRLEQAGGLFDALPHGLVRHLRDVLGDGRVSSLERESILTLVDQARLVPEDVKAEVRTLIEEWFRRDAGVSG